HLWRAQVFCTRCATFNPDDAFRCIGCGARLDPRERTRRSRQQSAGREHWFLVIPLGLALIALLFVGWRTWDAQRQQSAAYDRAMEALVTGDLTEAIAQFGRAGDYRDAAEQRLVTQQQRAAYQAAMLDAQIALDREETKHAVALLRSVVNALPDNADAATLLGIAEDRYRTELEQSITLAITQRAWLAAERAMLELAAFTGEPPDADALAALRLAHAPLLFTRDGILSRIGPDRADESVVMDDVPVAMPLWSPDRSKIAFFSVVTGAKYAGALFVVDADGSDLVLIDDRAMLSLPAWSPDSASIAYTGLVDPDDTGSRTTLAVADVGSGGKQHVPLPEDVRSLTSPSWSGDGGQLAAVAHKPTGGSIALVDTSSLEVSQPPIDLPVGIRAVSWSSSAPVLLIWTSTE
ncbi:MAG: PD40 domain-containing protein, partial [Thermomicrobiales bacterium]|nr:PD40 domain-containing protein [Thermomicrobiales bacterium]